MPQVSECLQFGTQFKVLRIVRSKVFYLGCAIPFDVDPFQLVF